MIASRSIGRTWILCFEIVVCIIVGVTASNASAVRPHSPGTPIRRVIWRRYRIHYGTASGSYTVHTDVHNVTTYTVTGLTAGQTYYFAATAYDASGNESGYSNPVSYAVPSANGAPTSPATPTGASSALVNTAIAFSTSATDPNGDSLLYRYDWGGGVLSGWGAASQSHSWSAVGQYAVQAQALNSRGVESAWSGTKTVTISQAQVVSLTLVNAATDRDIGPLANGDVINLSVTGSHLNIRANTSGSVGSVRFALDGNTNFRTESAAPYALMGDSSGDYASWTPALGSHSLTVAPYSASEGSGTVGILLSIDFTVTNVTPANEPPAANAGADQTVNAGTAVILNGSGSDPENKTLSYQWRQASGTAVTLTGATTQQLRFTAPSISTGSTSLVFELKTTDPAGLTATDAVSVAVQSADIDGDGVPNSQDAFPTNPAEWKDSNGNGIGDNAEAAAAAAKQAPDAPLLVSPVNTEVVSPMAILKTGAFRTAVTGTTHAKSRWQVFRDDDDVACSMFRAPRR